MAYPNSNYGRSTGGPGSGWDEQSGTVTSGSIGSGGGQGTAPPKGYSGTGGISGGHSGYGGGYDVTTMAMGEEGGGGSNGYTQNPYQTTQHPFAGSGYQSGSLTPAKSQPAYTGGVTTKPATKSQPAAKQGYDGQGANNAAGSGKAKKQQGNAQKAQGGNGQGQGGGQATRELGPRAAAQQAYVERRQDQRQNHIDAVAARNTRIQEHRQDLRSARGNPGPFDPPRASVPPGAGVAPPNDSPRTPFVPPPPGVLFPSLQFPPSASIPPGASVVPPTLSPPGGFQQPGQFTTPTEPWWKNFTPPMASIPPGAEVVPRMQIPPGAEVVPPMVGGPAYLQNSQFADLLKQAMGG